MANAAIAVAVWKVRSQCVWRIPGFVRAGFINFISSFLVYLVMWSARRFEVAVGWLPACALASDDTHC
jgi:predicted membrane-bound dolichyl-phosphate-mannose-protein mannosyltransferase